MDRLCFSYQGLLVLQRPRLHPFLRRRGCGSSHLRRTALGPPAAARAPAWTRLPAPSARAGSRPVPAAPAAECRVYGSRPVLRGRAEGGALPAAPPAGPSTSARPTRPGSALGPPPRLGRGDRGRLKRWRSRHLGRGGGLRRGRFRWRVEGPRRVCGSLRPDVRGRGSVGLRAF